MSGTEKAPHPDDGHYRPKHVGTILLCYFNVNLELLTKLINSAFVDVWTG